MSRPNSVCLVLHQHVTRADFEKAAAEGEFVHFETRPGDGNRVGYQQTWAWPNVEQPTTGVFYIESPLVSFHYIVVEGADPVLVDRLTSRLAVYTPELLLDGARYASAHDDQVQAINRMAIGFVNYNPAVFTIIETYATKSQNPLLREAAVNATGFRVWPQFRPLLERISAEDPDEGVRKHAAAMLSYIPAG